MNIKLLPLTTGFYLVLYNQKTQTTQQHYNSILAGPKLFVDLAEFLNEIFATGFGVLVW